MAARTEADAANARSADDAARIAVPHVVLRLARSLPHRQVMKRQESSRRMFTSADARQVYPRHGRMPMMRQVPVVVEPQPIDRSPQPQVARAVEHVPGGAEVMHVLHRGPGDA